MIRIQTKSCLRVHICMFLCRPGVVSVSLPVSIAASISIPLSIPVSLPVSLSLPIPVSVPVAAAVMGRGFHWSLKHQLILLALSWNLTHMSMQKTSE